MVQKGSVSQGIASIDGLQHLVDRPEIVVEHPGKHQDGNEGGTAQGRIKRVRTVFSPSPLLVEQHGQKEPGRTGRSWKPVQTTVQDITLKRNFCQISSRNSWMKLKTPSSTTYAGGQWYRSKLVKAKEP